jgi:hypothetical protein
LLSIYCLDPSCFISLETLEDTLSVLKALRHLEGEFQIYLPENLYNTINLDPEAKFRELPILISEWIYPEDNIIITELDREGRNRYVDVMRTILNTFNIQQFSFIGEDKGGDDKIGNESIHLKDLVKRFGKGIGSILFNMLSLSENLKSKIIAFGGKTIELVRKIGVNILEVRSEFKLKLKNKAGIKKGLKFMQYGMSLAFVGDFMRDYQTPPLDVSALGSEAIVIANIGLLLIGDD